MAQRDFRDMSDDELFTNWGEWISRTASELTEVFEHRFLFNSIREMFDHNEQLHTQSGQFIMEWQARLYGRDVLLFIRREFDYQHGTENILKLLREMEDRPTILTRARYRAFFETTQMPAEGKDGLANAFFNSFAIVGDGTDPNDHIAPEAIAAENAALKTGIEKVLLYANRNLAHRTPDWDVQPIMVPTDTDDALKAVQACFDRFYPLLTGKSMPQPTPAIQFDWEECFTHPWLTPEVVAKINEAERAEREVKANGVLEGIENPVRDK